MDTTPTGTHQTKNKENNNHNAKVQVNESKWYPQQKMYNAAGIAMSYARCV